MTRHHEANITRHGGAFIAQPLDGTWMQIGVAASLALRSLSQNLPENIDTVEEDREAMSEIEGRA